jgi:diguanylate cyclase (GGDEF)-like protein
MENNPEIATRMMYRMLNITTSRLKNTGNFLSDMVQFGETARKRAVTDEFTGLYNRRFLEDAVEEQFSLAKRSKKPLTIAMVDLDHFGTLNKEYGEQVGDRVLLEAVEVFRNVFVQNEILIRYGGDEFTFILPGATSVQARKLCNRVCEKLRKLTVLEGFNGSIRRVTSSIGIASYPEHAQSLKKLMECADSALYQAKEKGRNRTAILSG